jgi:hypothetical protein
MNVSIPFRSGLADVSMGCSPGDFQAGSVAGITVGTVALPLVMERVNRVLNFSATRFSTGRNLTQPPRWQVRGWKPRSLAAKMAAATVAARFQPPVGLGCQGAPFPTGNHSRWLPEPDKTDTLAVVKRSALDYRNPIPAQRFPDPTEAD